MNKPIHCEWEQQQLSCKAAGASDGFIALPWAENAEKTLAEFWCDVEKEYPEQGKHGLIELLPFGSTYMCEVTFSALTHIKTMQMNRLDVENSLLTAVSTMLRELSKLMKDKQAQVSH